MKKPHLLPSLFLAVLLPNLVLATEPGDLPYEIRQETFEFEATDVLDKATRTMTAEYLIKVDAEGLPVESAKNVLLYFPFYNEEKFFVRAFHRDLCEKDGFTVLTVRVPFRDHRLKEDPKRNFARNESGYGKTMWEAYDILLKKYPTLPRRKVFVTGESIGAFSAQNFILKFPDRVAAVALIGGAYSDDDSLPATVPMLVAYAVTDPSRGAGAYLSTLAKKQKHPMYYFAMAYPCWEQYRTDNLPHSPSEQLLSVVRCFLKDLSRHCDEAGKVLPREAWKTEKGENQSAENTLEATISQPVKYDFEKKNFDWEDRKVLFPSAEFKALWEHLPKRSKAYPVGDTTFVVFKTDYREPKGVVMLVKSQKGDTLFKSDQSFEALFFAERGFHVVEASPSDDEKGVEFLREVMRQATKLPDLKDLPFQIFSTGSGGAIAIAALDQSPPAEIKGIFVLNPPTHSQTALPSVMEALPRLSIPSVFYFGVNPVLQRSSQSAELINAAKDSAVKPHILVDKKYDYRSVLKNLNFLSEVETEMSAKVQKGTRN